MSAGAERLFCPAHHLARLPTALAKGASQSVRGILDPLCRRVAKRLLNLAKAMKVSGRAGITKPTLIQHVTKRSFPMPLYIQLIRGAYQL